MIYFTSDLHFYHKNVIAYCNRPYESVEEMNEKLILNWNNVVSPDDTVYCLGDFSLTLRPVELYTTRLNGYKILISGNHDWTHSANKKARNEERKRDMIAKYIFNGWSEVHDHAIFNYEGVSYNLSHMPYRGDTTDDRHHRHRLDDDGKILLCGHVHGKWAAKRTPKGTLMINVGVDVRNYAPISINEIVGVVKSEEEKFNGL